MKKILCLLLVLLLLPLTAEARREPDYIGKSKSIKSTIGPVTAGQIVRGDAKVWMVNLINNLNQSKGSFLTLYDEYQTPHEANIIMELEIATTGNSETVVLEYPIDVSNGLYYVLESGTCVILYE